MKIGKFLLAAASVLMMSGSANAQSVVAESTVVINFYNTLSLGEVGRLRDGGVGDNLLGNAGGNQFRNLVVLFDPADYQSLASDPNLELTSAELVMVENANDTAGVTADIFAYFSDEANGGFSITSPNLGNQMANSGPGGFLGNTGARRGPFGGGNGADNTNPFYTAGVTPVSHTFVTGEDTITIDLAAGGISLADIKTTLADDDVSNAGIFMDSPLESQIRLQNGFELRLTFAPGNNNTVLLGDVDLSGDVTFLDIAPFITLLSNNAFQDEADIDLDGAVTFLDIQPFINILSGN